MQKNNFWLLNDFLDLSISTVKESQSGVLFFAKGSLSIFAPRSFVFGNHKKRPTDTEDIGRSMNQTININIVL